MSSHIEFIESVLEDTKQKLRKYEQSVKSYEKMERIDEYYKYKLLVSREKVESTKIHIETLEEELKIAKNQ